MECSQMNWVRAKWMKRKENENTVTVLW
uniref:Uncharacterized protein n=1 Tax=Rhizophora mucronata TaxID=61149 RepID=A0A2P2QHF3_RHIMU